MLLSNLRMQLVPCRKLRACYLYLRNISRYIIDAITRKEIDAARTMLREYFRTGVVLMPTQQRKIIGLFVFA